MAEEILNFKSHIYKHLEFKLMCQENGTSFLDLSVTRNKDKLTIDIFQKAKATDNTIHYN